MYYKNHMLIMILYERASHFETRFSQNFMSTSKWAPNFGGHCIWSVSLTFSLYVVKKGCTRVISDKLFLELGWYPFRNGSGFAIWNVDKNVEKEFPSHIYAERRWFPLLFPFVSVRNKHHINGRMKVCALAVHDVKHNTNPLNPSTTPERDGYSKG